MADTKNKIDVLDEKIKKENEKIAQLKAQKKALLAREGKKERASRTSRLCAKAGQYEAVLAFAHMTQLENLDFIKDLLGCPDAVGLIVSNHVKTGGTQYKTVDEFRQYVAVKMPEVEAEAVKRSQK